MVGLETEKIRKSKRTSVPREKKNEENKKICEFVRAVLISADGGQGGRHLAKKKVCGSGRRYASVDQDSLMIPERTP